MGRASNRRTAGRRVAATFLASAIAAATGCASRSFFPSPGFERDPVSSSLADGAEGHGPFEYADPPPVVDNHDLKDNGPYRLSRLSFPSVGDNGQPGNLVTVDYHQSKLPGRWPAVIVMPVWGISSYPSRRIVNQIRRRSGGTMQVLDLQGEAFLLDWERLQEAPDESSFLSIWTENAERERTMLIDIRRLVDWAEARPEIDAGRLALVGFSHSAILAATVAAQEPRFAATVLVFGGAHPHEVIAHCDGKRTTRLQDKVASEFGWSKDEYQRRLAPIFQMVDPAEYPGRVDPDRVLLFEAENDPCIPQDAYRDLRRALGWPARYTVDAGHRKAFYTMTPLYLNWLQRKAWDFLEGALAETPRH